MHHLFFVIHYWINMNIESVQIPYKFNVSSWKMIKIVSCHQKLNFHIL
jgi:hypothetical protein